MLDLYQELKYIFFLLSIFVHELISTPKIITFLPVQPLECEKKPCLSNPILYLEYLYLSISGSLIKLTTPNKQFPSAE